MAASDGQRGASLNPRWTVGLKAALESAEGFLGTPRDDRAGPPIKGAVQLGLVGIPDQDFVDQAVVDRRFRG